jgi:AmmeMemoRadiSam system protein A
MVQGRDSERNFGEQYEEIHRRLLAEQRKKEDAYVRLARKTIEEYVGKGQKIKVPEELPEEMYSGKAGVFVSIKEDGKLRGCIGTIQAVRSSIAEEIIENAISAAAKDSRFSPIEPEELGRLVISVDVLGSMESIDSPDELDVKKYGVVVTKGYKRGLLLPNLEGVDTVEEQIGIAKRKAGIGEEEKVQLERFEVVRHY